MTRNLTVVPVTDYEPPIGTPRRPSPMVGPPARSLVAVPPLPEQPAAHAAAAFADAALRGVLEVVDGRRPFAQLQPLLGAGLADTVIALARSRSDACGATIGSRGPGTAAQLRRVRLRIVDRDGDVAEVFATYYRDGRVRAIAGRVARAELRGRRRWRLIALQMG
jgi:hypothetical protein